MIGDNPRLLQRLVVAFYSPAIDTTDQRFTGLDKDGFAHFPEPVPTLQTGWLEEGENFIRPTVNSNDGLMLAMHRAEINILFGGLMLGKTDGCYADLQNASQNKSNVYVLHNEFLSANDSISSARLHNHFICFHSSTVNLLF